MGLRDRLRVIVLVHLVCACVCGRERDLTVKLPIHLTFNITVELTINEYAQRSSVPPPEK